MCNVKNIGCNGRAGRQHRLSRSAASRRAFTLIELILILALLVVVTSLVAPAVSTFVRGRSLDAEARRFISLIHAAQSRAVSEGMPVMLWVDEKANTYGVELQTPGDKGDDKAETLDVDETLQVAVIKTSAGAQTTIHGLPAIKFLPDGTVDEDSPKKLQLTHANGGVLWLVESPNHMGYEVQDTQ